MLSLDDLDGFLGFLGFLGFIGFIGFLGFLGFLCFHLGTFFLKSSYHHLFKNISHVRSI